MPRWEDLTDAEQEQYLIRTPCPTCKAKAWTWCKMSAQPVLSPWHLARVEGAARHWEWDQGHSAPYEPAYNPQRTLGELMGRQHEKRDKALDAEAQRYLDEAEAARTCPWCGTLFDTVILMEEHEVDCE